MRVSASFVCVLVLTMAGLVRAEPLNPKQVPADAKWLAHVDADVMRTSVVVDQGMKERGDAVKALIAKVPDLSALCEAIDPAKNVKGITVYGTQFKPGGVAIVSANLAEAALNSLSEGVQKLPDHATTSHGSHELHTWTHAKGTPHAHAVTAVYVEPNILVFGTSVDEVKNALDVLDGAKPNIVGKSALAAPAPAGALVFARVAGLGTLKGLPVDSPIIKQADVIGLTIRQVGGPSDPGLDHPAAPHRHLLLGADVVGVYRLQVAAQASGLDVHHGAGASSEGVDNGGAR